MMKKKIALCIVLTLVIATIAVVPTTAYSEEKPLKIRQIVDKHSISGEWVEKIKLLAPDGEEYDTFGVSVSICGDTALIGELGDNAHSGAAYVFRCNGTSWALEAKLTASDEEPVWYFGQSVSIDGDTALIGAPYSGFNATGSAYVFTRNGTSWTQEAKLLFPDGEMNDWYGWSASIDGDTVIIGAPGDNENDTGSAYIFKRDGTSWAQEAKLLASDGAAYDSFGTSVSIDGEYAIIGAEWNDDNGNNSGSAYVFTRNGTSWTEEAKLLPSDGDDGDKFGRYVSIDGETALIGAAYDDDNGENSGSAYIFTRNGTSWTEEAKLLASDGEAEDVFGVSVSLDGDTALIGACTVNEPGYAYVFTRNGTSWTEEAKLIPSDGQHKDWFGGRVSIDGNTALIGAEGDDDNGFWSGSAYIFEKTDTQPPNNPIITGPTSGKPNTEYEFTFCTTDPDGDPIRYIIDWGDNNTEWTEYSDSGEEIILKHSWSEKGVYIIRAKALDINGAESDWSELEITMPRDKQLANTFSTRFIEQFKDTFSILRQLLKL
jgi:hypothetical protein